MSDKAEITLKPETLAVSALVTKNQVLDKETGSSEVGIETFEATLPEGLTVDTVKKVFDHVQVYGAGLTHGYGSSVVPILKKNDKLEYATVTAKLPGRNNNIEVTVFREKIQRNPADIDNPTTVYGATDYRLKLSAGKQGKGEISRARSLVRQMASGSFGK